MPRGTAASRRAERARDFGPGTAVFRLIVLISVTSFVPCSVTPQYQPMGCSFKLMYTCLVSRYSSTPHGPSSRPKPDCLYPPHGASTYVGCMWLTHTIPARRDFTVRKALKMSRVQTAAASP